MRPPFRMYISQGCNNCKQALDFLNKAGFPVETIDVGFDPLIAKGMAVLYGNVNPITPLLICFANQEMVAGWSLENYARIVADFNSIFGVKPVDIAPDAGKLAGAPKSLAKPTIRN